MFRLGLPLLLLIVIGVVVAVTTSQRHHDTSLYRAAGPAPPKVHRAGQPPIGGPTTWLPPAQSAATSARALGRDLDRWVDASLITRDQADAIRRHEEGRVAAALAPKPARRIPVVAEALGYLGGMLGIAGIATLVANSWSDMSSAARLGISIGTAVTLVTAGALIHERAEAALARLRGFVWLAGTAGTGLAAGVVAYELFDANWVGTLFLVAAAAVTVLSAVLWWGRDRPLQQLTLCAGIVVTAGMAVAQVAAEALTGLAIWLTAAVLMVVGLRVRVPNAWIITACGAIGGVAGGLTMSNQWEAPGLLLAAATAAATVGIAVARPITLPVAGRVLLSVIGGMALLMTLPATVGTYAEHAGIVTGLIVWAIGGLLLLIGARDAIRVPVLAEIVGGLAVVGGAAVTGAQSVAFATTFGLLTAVALLALGMLPGRVLLSVAGSLGLLVNVPWAIQHWFPGQGRAPLLIAVAGLVLILVAVMLTRMGGRFRKELRS